MRQEIIELGKLGPLPPSDRAVRENLQELFDEYGMLIMSVRKPVTDEEARVLITILVLTTASPGFGRLFI
jgi:hypothetical protein